MHTRQETHCQITRALRANLAWPCVETRANLAWQCVFWLAQRAKTCDKIWYLGPLSTILLSQTTWQALHAQQEMGGDCLVTDKLNIQLKIFYIETSIFIYYYFFEVHHNIVTTTVPEDNRRFRGQNQWPSSLGRTPARLARVRRASANTGRFRVGCSRCGPRRRPARLRKTYYQSCDTDLVREILMLYRYQAVMTDFFSLEMECPLE